MSIILLKMLNENNAIYINVLLLSENEVKCYMKLLFINGKFINVNNQMRLNY